jgi:hypothetical protein
MRERGSATCNDVLPLIQWVGRSAASFMTTISPAKLRQLNAKAI